MDAKQARELVSKFKTTIPNRILNKIETSASAGINYCIIDWLSSDHHDLLLSLGYKVGQLETEYPRYVHFRISWHE